MNILFVSGHPAQIHNFKNVKYELEKRGHRVFWLATDKDISKQLLEVYNIDYSVLNKPGKSILARVSTLISNTVFSLKYLKANKIDLVVSRVSPYLAVASFIKRIFHITLTDTETAGFYDWFFCKFTSVLLTSFSFKKQLRSKQIRFDANTELFYLHPNRFKPVNNVENLLGIQPGEPYVIMRFVNWGAYHDKGLSGFTDENKMRAVESFSKFAKVYISSENEIPRQLEKYKINIPVEKIHDVLTHANLFFGESATMATESALLGTPAIFMNENWFGSTGEAEEYGLLFSFRSSSKSQTDAISKGVELLSDPKIKREIQQNRASYLKNKIDVTAFMVWFIENYPESYKIMRENPEYQYKFR